MSIRSMTFPPICIPSNFMPEPSAYIPVQAWSIGDGPVPISIV